MSNNGCTTYTRKYLSFINKYIGALYAIVLTAFLVPCIVFISTYWSEIPIIVKVISPIVLLMIFVAILFMPLNGLLITKKGAILFVPDFRFKKLNVKDLKKTALIFNEWENNKYSTTVKFVYKDGRFFVKDYSRQFRNLKIKKIALPMYTISKERVDKICKKLLDLDMCVITIVDKNKNILCQSKQEL